MCLTPRPTYTHTSDIKDTSSSFKVNTGRGWREEEKKNRADGLKNEARKNNNHPCQSRDGGGVNEPSSPVAFWELFPLFLSVASESVPLRGGLTQKRSDMNAALS